ncbi:MAG: zinc ABC transporter substrate-binding protein [Planctomycetota bacterium]
MLATRGRGRVRRTVCALLVAVSGLGVGGCAKAPERPPTPNAGYEIVCTTGMVADIVRQVAGAHATVTGLIGSGVDPHLYVPTRQDISALQRAPVVFYSGLMLEGKMTGALEKLAGGGKLVRPVTAGLEAGYLLESERAAGHPDPHVWMDVRAWSRAVDTVARTLAEYDPLNAATYETNARKYQQDLEELDAYVRQVLGSVPEPQRILVTAHDAFRYFGRAYGLRVQGIQGISTESEAGLEDINRLVDLIVRQDVRAVFVETSVADKSVRALIEGAAARGKTVQVGGRLFSDAMGPPGAYEGTYIGMIDHNATTIARALGGQAPEGGWRGRLGAPATRPDRSAQAMIREAVGGAWTG